MKKFFGVLLVTIFLAAGSLFLVPTESEAVPAFARQTGQNCTSCHFQHIPMLNAFGREFKAGGFTMVGGDSLLSGDMLSLPSVLNASLILKVRYQKTDGDSNSGTDQGELQFPDEAALLTGGRIGENIGFSLESALQGGDMFTSFKMPFVFNAGSARISVIPFTTDALGVSYGFELLNTGAVRNIRTFEHRKETSSQQYVNTATAAQGVALVLSHNLGYLNYSAWIPNHEAANAIHSTSHYLRGVLTQQAGDWDLAGGVQAWFGTSTFDDMSANARTRAWAIDAQAQGAVGHMPLGIYASYASAKGSAAGETANLFNGNVNNRTAFTLTAELGVIPHKATVGASYRAGKNGRTSDDKDNAFTLAATYELAQNVELQIDHSWYSGSANADRPNLLTLMLEAGF